MNGSLSLAKIAGLLFFASYCFYNNSLLFPNRSFPRPPSAMWWFAGYIAVYALNGFFVPEEFFYEFRTGLFTLVQLIVLFWCTSDLLKEENVARSFLFIYSIAAVIFALGVTLNIPGFTVEMEAGRLTAFGNNPNAIGQVMASAAVVLIGLYLNTIFKHVMSRILLIVLIFPLIAVMVGSASRAGILAFLTGCLAYLVPFLKSKRKFAGIVLVLLSTVAVVYLAVNSPLFFERMQRTYYEGNAAGREAIFPAALEMILERPILGWRPVEFSYELAFRNGWTEFVDAHNLFLRLLLEGGLIGAIPFFVAFCLCGWAAWKARSGNLGLLPIALFLTLFVTNMSGTGLYEKQLWIFLALAIAAKSALAKTSRKRLAVLLKSAPLSNRT